MSKLSKKMACVAVAASLALGTVTPSMAATAPTHQTDPSVLVEWHRDAVNSPVQQLDELAGAPTLPTGEAQETEGGLPLAIVLALAGAASAMGFYLYGVLVQGKKFNKTEFARRGGCGAVVGLLGRFIAGRAAAIRIFGSGATGAALAACFR